MSDDKSKNANADKARNPLQPRLGKYSNDRDEYYQEQKDARLQVVRHVGDYVLTLDPVYPLWTVERMDGKPVHKSLQGKWKSPSIFRQRMVELQQNG